MFNVLNRSVDEVTGDEKYCSFFKDFVRYGRSPTRRVSYVLSGDPVNVLD